MSILDMSLAGAVFIIAVVVVRAILINRIPKRAFLALWEIAFLRLIIPFAIPFRFSIYTLVNRILFGLGFIKAESDTSISALAQRNSIAIQESGTIYSSVLPATSIWFVIWCMGMILSVSFFAVAYFRCRLEFQASLPICNDYVEQWLKEHAIRRSISVRHSDRILTPLTYGILRPVILMPKTTDWENAEQLQYVLAHEYMHIRHFDIARKLFATVVLCIHWFNPMVWILYILFNSDIELACDESVIQQFGEKSRTVYSLILISMEEKQNGLLPFCNNFSKNAIEERITAIMKMKKVTVLSFVVVCLLVGGIVAAFATSAQAVNAEASLGGQESEFIAPDMQPYGKDFGRYCYLAEDYVLDGKVVYPAGYYEAVKLVDDSDLRIFVPINPNTFERLPSDHFSDGTIMEIEGKDYEIHINDNQYTATLKE